jgi:intracellular sulfur oxidation DsrE/DsrF family protein
MKKPDTSRRSIFAPLAAGALALFGAGPAAGAKPARGKHRVVFQVSESDPKRWTLTLSNIRNVQQEFGERNVTIALVAFGPGIDMLKFESETGNRVQEAMKSGVAVAACTNTMDSAGLTPDDMLPGVTYVKAGVADIILRQEQGYAYIRS